MKLIKLLCFLVLLSTLEQTEIVRHNSKVVKKVNEFPMNPIDLLSYSNFFNVKQTKLLFNVEILLDKELIAGDVRVFYDCLTDVRKVVLDVKTLDVFSVKDSNGNELKYHFVRNMSKSRAVGRGLIIKLVNDCKSGSKDYVDVNYSTTIKSIAIHFSHPTMLEDKNYKFMYSHGPAIFGRTMVPCQDTPSAKVLLEARIRIDKPYTVLFSGVLQKVKTIKNKKSGTQLEYHFTSDIPISPYLISFSAGVLSKKEFGDQCVVYAEVPFIDSKKITNTFVKCSDYVKFYSKTYFKNPWGKMIFIVLPDDFPYAGMENPYGIQISKSVLTDDGSNKNVIAHEIAHFWSGNMVTALTWGSFWLNEGLTNYLYRKAFLHVLGKKLFVREVFRSSVRLKNFIKGEKENLKKEKDKSYMSLSPKIENYDPYSHFSLIPYEKGFSFLYFLENKIGEKNMNKLLREYFKTFAFSNATTADFKKIMEKTINKNFDPEEAEEILREIKWKKWVKGIGGIPVKFKIKSKQVRLIKKLIKEFSEKTYRLDQMIQIFESLDTFYKNTLLNQLSRNTKKINEKSFEDLKQFCQYYFTDKENRKKLEISTLANIYLLRVKLDKNNMQKLRLLLILLRKVKFYHASYLKRIFAIFKKDMKMKKKKMLKILTKIGYRLNKLTTFRVLQFILKK